ncbi:hypothetical protein QVD17_26005 [Tagetes erecta]|uniref:Uncharacterized protein n=1 Tax=Tagetes erecta TaxID=13708 RepID=A0AAD8K8J1_TARER|nr:hypothetical protein QVD17_26005 [Tagetes erecta]
MFSSGLFMKVYVTTLKYFIRFCTTTAQFQLRFHFTNSIPFHFNIFNHEADSTTTTTVAAGSGNRNNNNRPRRRPDLTPQLPQREPQIAVLLPLPPYSSSKWKRMSEEETDGIPRTAAANGTYITVKKMRGEARERHTKLDPKVRA